MIDKETWVKLAEAQIADRRYAEDLYDAKRRLAKHYNIEADFIGLDIFSGRANEAVDELLGEEFEYFMYECGGDWEEYNARCSSCAEEWKYVDTLEELYNISMGEDNV